MKEPPGSDPPSNPGQKSVPVPVYAVTYAKSIQSNTTPHDHISISGPVIKTNRNTRQLWHAADKSLKLIDKKYSWSCKLRTLMGASEQMMSAQTKSVIKVIFHNIQVIGYRVILLLNILVTRLVMTTLHIIYMKNKPRSYNLVKSVTGWNCSSPLG